MIRRLISESELKTLGVTHYTQLPTPNKELRDQAGWFVSEDCPAAMKIWRESAPPAHIPSETHLDGLAAGSCTRIGMITRAVCSMLHALLGPKLNELASRDGLLEALAMIVEHDYKGWYSKGRCPRVDTLERDVHEALSRLRCLPMGFKRGMGRRKGARPLASRPVIEFEREGVVLVLVQDHLPRFLTMSAYENARLLRKAVSHDSSRLRLVESERDVLLGPDGTENAIRVL